MKFVWFQFSLADVCSADVPLRYQFLKRERGQKEMQIFIPFSIPSTNKNDFYNFLRRRKWGQVI